MSIDRSVVGVPGPPLTVSWSADDVVLYALAVGVGDPDPLAFTWCTTENTVGAELSVLPTYGAVLAHRAETDIPGDYDRANALHAEQAIEIYRPLPSSGSAVLVSTVVEVADKGSGALVVNECEATDPTDGQRLFRARSSAFIRGEGGWGERSSATGPAAPTGPPTTTVSFRLRPDQALLYRLTGDRNPLHTDPEVARRVGFERPILHGMCTYGITAQLLSRHLAGDPASLASITGRFSAPVWPGDTLYVEMWETDPVSFRTRRSDGTVVIDRGAATL